MSSRGQSELNLEIEETGGDWFYPSSDIAVLCAKFRRGWTTVTHIMGKWDIARFEYKMSFGWISYIAQNPRYLCATTCCKIMPVQHFCTLQWRHNGRDGISNHQPHDCVLSRLFGRRSKKTSKVRTGLCEGNSPVTGEFPTQRASNADNVSIWWHHHGYYIFVTKSTRVHMS